eukprot:RCo023076
MLNPIALAHKGISEAMTHQHTYTPDADTFRFKFPPPHPHAFRRLTLAPLRSSPTFSCSTREQALSPSPNSFFRGGNTASFCPLRHLPTVFSRSLYVFFFLVL